MNEPVVTIPLARYEELLSQVASAEARVKAAVDARPFFHVMEPVKLEELKTLYVRRIVEHCAGNATAAAKLIKVHRQTIDDRRIKPEAAP